MEGLTSMAIHLREGFERYAPPVYEQAVAVLSWQVEAKTVSNVGLAGLVLTNA